mgnify:CR=1 FL=1
MTKAKFAKIMKEVKLISQDGPMDDEAAYDTAAFILMDNPGLKEYIQKNVGAFDAQGWLADEI